MAAAAVLAGNGDDDRALSGRRRRGCGLRGFENPPVETPVEGTDEMDDGAYDERSDDRTFAHTVDDGHEDKRQDARNQDQRHVEAQLDVPEIATDATRDGAHEVLARGHGHVYLDLQRNTDGQNDTPHEKISQFAEIFNRLNPPKQAHRSVDEQTETERNGNLKQIDPKICAQVIARHKEKFQEDEPHIDNDGPLAHRQRREETQHIGNAGNRRGAEQRPGNEGDTQSVDKQRNDEQQITTKKIYIHEYVF